MLGYQAPATIDEVLAFHVHWDVLALAGVLVVGYLYGLRRLAPAYAPQGEPPVTPPQRVLFFTGVAVLVVVRGWPVHDVGEGSMFMFHMVEHLALALVVPPLLLLGAPWWLLRVLVRPILPALRVITRPVVALVIFNAVIALIHVPRVVELMVTNQAFHLGAHAVLFVAAVVMWWPVVGPIPDLPRLPPFRRMGYLFLQSLVPTIPASFMTLTSAPIYAVYVGLPKLWGVSALDDQVIAGLIMKLAGGLILWTAIAITFFRWAAEEDRHAAGLAPSPQ